MSTQPVVIKVIIKDMGRQGLEAFFPEMGANPGHIECWGTLMTYERGTQDHPGPATAPMAWGEASQTYFWSGRKPKPDDPRLPIFLARLARELAPAVVVRIFKDTQPMRTARWS